jgi:hypothetical protein
MGLSFRRPHRWASILQISSLTSNFRKAEPRRAEVAGKVDLPACLGIKKSRRRH